MEILSLKLQITDADVAALAKEHMPKDVPIRDLEIHLTPEGARVNGRYPTPLFSVSFQTLWALSIREGKLSATLKNLQVAGVPIGMVRGLLMEMLTNLAEREEGVTVEGETILIDVDAQLTRFGVEGRTNLTGITCSEGSLILQGGNTA